MGVFSMGKVNDRAQHHIRIEAGVSGEVSGGPHQAIKFLPGGD